MIAEIWRRALTVQPEPPPATVAVIAFAALVLVIVPATWPATRMMVTITHEGAHAVAALFTGRRLRGIRLHSDTSGLMVSQGRSSGPGMIITLIAGYLGPAVVGLGAALLLGAGRSLGLLWLMVIVLALMLVQIRNLYGFVVLVAAGGAMTLISWYLSPVTQSTIAYLITWLLLVAAPKPVLELMRQRHRRSAGRSDADQLAVLTRVPGLVWTLLFLAANLAGLVLGVLILLPGLPELVETVTAPAK